MFSRYAALVKNMRGVVYFDPSEEEAYQGLKWLNERFKYRVLGVPPSLLKSLNRVSKPLIPLAYPHHEIESFTSTIARSLNLELSLSEALCLSSCYVSPILALGSRAQERLKSIAVHEVYTKTSMGLKDWKLHLRIADYSVLDLYEWSTLQAQKIWEPDVDIKKLLEERTKAIKRDEKRYWRLQRGDLEPKLFMVYLDLLQRISRSEEAMNNVKSFSPNLASACMAVVVAVMVSPS